MYRRLTKVPDAAASVPGTPPYTPIANAKRGTMSLYRFVVDQDRCIACRACEAACKTAHDSAPGIALGSLLMDGPRFEDAEFEATPILTKHAPAGTSAAEPVPDGERRVVLHTRYRACPQCGQARCMEACPRGALIRREKDGIIFVEESLCVGCGRCTKACPHHLIWVDRRRRKAVKCDRCKDRLDAGLTTACVTVCPTRALRLVKKEEMTSPR